MILADEPVKSILFVCTGNIFRSLTAEYALKQYLGPQGMDCVGSAGSEAQPQSILDGHEALPEWKQNVEQAHTYVLSVVDRICDAIPHFAARLSHLR